MNGTPRPRSWLLPTLVALFALAAACGDNGAAEAGFDAGVSDAGVSDAGVSDAGVSDAGVSDAGVSDAGVSDAEIVIGGHAPLSGPAAIFAEVHRGAGAYFDHINETEGGVGGRRIEYRLRDDQYPNPARLAS